MPQQNKILLDLGYTAAWLSGEGGLPSKLTIFRPGYTNDKGVFVHAASISVIGTNNLVCLVKQIVRALGQHIITNRHSADSEIYFNRCVEEVETNKMLIKTAKESVPCPTSVNDMQSPSA